LGYPKTKDWKPIINFAVSVLVFFKFLRFFGFWLPVFKIGYSIHGFWFGYKNQFYHFKGLRLIFSFFDSKFFLKQSITYDWKCSYAFFIVLYCSKWKNNYFNYFFTTGLRAVVQTKLKVVSLWIWIFKPVHFIISYDYGFGYKKLKKWDYNRSN